MDDDVEWAGGWGRSHPTSIGGGKGVNREDDPSQQILGLPRLVHWKVEKTVYA
jgi:hypothetical protein